MCAFPFLVPEMEITFSVETEGGTGTTDPKVIVTYKLERKRRLLRMEEKLAHR